MRKPHSKTDAAPDPLEAFADALVRRIQAAADAIPSWIIYTLAALETVLMLALCVLYGSGS